MNTLKILSKGYAQEAKRIRHLETKSEPAEALTMMPEDLYKKYGKGLTLVQLGRLIRRHRRVLSVTHRQRLHRDRTHTLRKESRCVTLARAYFAGRNYGDLERICYELPNWDRVQQLVLSNVYPDKDQRAVMQEFSEWLSNAKDYINCCREE